VRPWVVRALKFGFLGTKLLDAEEALRVVGGPNLIPKTPRTNVQPLHRYKAAQLRSEGLV
jgi:hypothetical protein